jgi:hypothetical protein
MQLQGQKLLLRRSLVLALEVAAVCLLALLGTFKVMSYPCLVVFIHLRLVTELLLQQKQPKPGRGAGQKRLVQELLSLGAAEFEKEWRETYGTW